MRANFGILSLLVAAVGAQASGESRCSGPSCPLERIKCCPGYDVISMQPSETGISAVLEIGGSCRVYGPDIFHLALTVDYETETRLHVKITDLKNERYQIPETIMPRPSSAGVKAEQAALEFRMIEAPFSFQIVRKADQMVIFDTSRGGDVNSLVFEDQYLELSTHLPLNANIYG